MPALYVSIKKQAFGICDYLAYMMLRSKDDEKKGENYVSKNKMFWGS